MGEKDSFRSDTIYKHASPQEGCIIASDAGCRNRPPVLFCFVYLNLLIAEVLEVSLLTDNQH